MKQAVLKLVNLLPPNLIKKIKEASYYFNYRLYFYTIKKKALLPSSIVIDPVNFCNLNCALCPSGLKLLRQKKEILTLELFKKIVQQIPSLKKISLFNWGESFLNPEIFAILRFASKKGIFTVIHSNFSFKKNQKFFQAILDSKLDRLSISLDGVQQKSYEKYRRGGNFNLVFKNLKNLANLKAEQNRKKPQIIWQYLINRFNESEIEQAKVLADDLGVQLNLSPLGFDDNLPDCSFPQSLKKEKKYWLPLKQKPEEKPDKKKAPFPYACPYLFNEPTIAPDGKVYPCCLITDEKNAFGDLTQESFATIWNNDKFQKGRELFIQNNKNLTKTSPIVCEQCKIYQKF